MPYGNGQVRAIAILSLSHRSSSHACCRHSHLAAGMAMESTECNPCACTPISISRRPTRTPRPPQTTPHLLQLASSACVAYMLTSGVAFLDCLIRPESWQVSCAVLQDPPGGSMLAGGVTVAMDAFGHEASGTALPGSYSEPHIPSHPHLLADPPALFSSQALSAPVSDLDTLDRLHVTRTPCWATLSLVHPHFSHSLNLSLTFSLTFSLTLTLTHTPTLTHHPSPITLALTFAHILTLTLSRRSSLTVTSFITSGLRSLTP